MYQSRWFARVTKVVQSKRFDSTIDVILVANAITILVQDYSLLAGYDSESENTGTLNTNWEKLETLFTTLYVWEAILKVTVNGWKKYSESPRNVFDFCITCLTILASFYVYCEYDVSQYGKVGLLLLYDLASLLISVTPQIQTRTTTSTSFDLL